MNKNKRIHNKTIHLTGKPAGDGQRWIQKNDKPQKHERINC
jgi:hypothetical protein